VHVCREIDSRQALLFGRTGGEGWGSALGEETRRGRLQWRDAGVGDFVGNPSVSAQYHTRTAPGSTVPGSHLASPDFHELF
jgi:hypothetical protein